MVSARSAAVVATSSGATSSKSSKPTVRPGASVPVRSPVSPTATQRHREPRADLLVLDEQPVGVGDEDVAPPVGVRRARPAAPRSRGRAPRRRPARAPPPSGPCRSVSGRLRRSVRRVDGVPLEARRRGCRRAAPRAAAAAGLAASRSPAAVTGPRCGRSRSTRPARRARPRRWRRPDTSSSTRPSSRRPLDEVAVLGEHLGEVAAGAQRDVQRLGQHVGVKQRLLG